MKANRFTSAILVVLLFSLSGWAGGKMSATIHLYETLHVGSTELAPGEYKMTWTQSGSNAEVTFSQNKRVIATVPARVAEVRSGYSDPVVEINTTSNTLDEVNLPKVSISFGSESAVPPSSNSN